MHPKKFALRKLSLILSLAAGITLAFGLSSLAGPPASVSPAGQMTLEELERMPKIDAHAHVREGGVADEKLFIELLQETQPEVAGYLRHRDAVGETPEEEWPSRNHFTSAIPSKSPGLRRSIWRTGEMRIGKRPL